MRYRASDLHLFANLNCSVKIHFRQQKSISVNHLKNKHTAHRGISDASQLNFRCVGNKFPMGEKFFSDAAEQNFRCNENFLPMRRSRTSDPM